jgi:hypothetical protein
VAENAPTVQAGLQQMTSAQRQQLQQMQMQMQMLMQQQMQASQQQQQQQMLKLLQQRQQQQQQMLKMLQQQQQQWMTQTPLVHQQAQLQQLQTMQAQRMLQPSSMAAGQTPTMPDASTMTGTPGAQITPFTGVAPLTPTPNPIGTPLALRPSTPNVGANASPLVGASTPTTMLTEPETRPSPRIIPCGIVAASTGEPCRRPVNRLGDVCRLHQRYKRSLAEIAALHQQAAAAAAAVATPPPLPPPVVMPSPATMLAPNTPTRVSS